MRREYAFINPFRALAAAWVLVAHCMIWGGWYGLPVPSAKIAVDVFMVISGFLMTANANDRWNGEAMSEPGNRRRFWLRRYFRLAPVYYLALAIAALGAGFFLPGKSELQALNRHVFPIGGHYDPALTHYGAANLLTHVTFLFGLLPSYAGATSLPDWSLSLEMQFYVVFPMLFLLMRRYGVLRTTVALSAVAIVLGRVIALHVRYPEPSLLPFKLQYFLAGALVFYSITTKHRALGIAAMVLCALEPEYRGQMFVCAFVVGAMLLLGSFETRVPTWLGALLRHRVTLFASDVSYAVYLFHGFFIGTFGALLGAHVKLRELAPMPRTAALALFVIPCVYAAAYVVHRFVEQPGIRLGRRVADRLSPASVGVIEHAPLAVGLTPSESKARSVG